MGIESDIEALKRKVASLESKAERDWKRLQDHMNRIAKLEDITSTTVPKPAIQSVEEMQGENFPISMRGPFKICLDGQQQPETTAGDLAFMAAADLRDENADLNEKIEELERKVKQLESDLHASQERCRGYELRLTNSSKFVASEQKKQEEHEDGQT